MVKAPPPSIWERLVEVEAAPMTADAARHFLAIQFSEADKRRFEELGERCQLGTLDPSERGEYEELVKAGMVLSIWHARARKALKELGNDRASHA